VGDQRIVRIAALSEYRLPEGKWLELKLDVITKGSQPRPVVIFFHGGGWVQGKKENHLLKLLPYLAHGMNGVNVEYRLANEGKPQRRLRIAAALYTGGLSCQGLWL